MKTVAFIQPVWTSGDIKLNLAFEHISELFSFVLNQAFAASARFNMIDVAREKMTGGRWNDCLELHAVATAHLIGFDHGALSPSQDDILGVSSKLKEAGYWRTQRRRDPMNHFQGWIGATILDLRKERFRTLGDVGQIAKSQSLQQTGVSNLWSDSRRRRTSSNLSAFS